ncbi:hypothetical protein [Pseudonocardia sp. GCM10023141]|uniref:hypothetical protein n=1 Tax=Pseudonocardia sp. GCM10023141 TaxID=3252653 RepID=UPI003614F641
MRSYPIDAERVRLISTGTVSPVTKWVELSDGSRRPDPTGRQDEDENGRPLWRVEVIMPADEGDDRDKTGVAEITVASKDRPDPGAFGDLLVFEGLVVSPGYVNKRSGQLTPARWSANGIRKQGGRAAAAAA